MANRTFRFILVVLGALAATAAWLIVAAWILGLILSDRWGWSQWLAWMPSLAALAAAALGFVAAWRPAKPAMRRRRLVTWCAILLVTAAFVVLIDARPLRTAPALPDIALRIVHWNASPAERSDYAEAIHLVLDLDAHIIVLTDAHLIKWHAEARRALGEDGHVASSSPFGFISRLPIVEVRPLVAVDDMYAALLVLDGSSTALARELRILAIDLPSDLAQSRMAMTKRMSDMLLEAGAAHLDADIILGDFNITRGSASLSLLAPNMRHAWNEAGRGWSGTYPRRRPLLHIDHLFINPQTMRAVDYEILDLGASRHRAQRAVVEPR